MLCKLALVLAFGFATFSNSSAQCFTGPDGLTGPCCTLVPVNLPTFPTASLPSTVICWDTCVPTQNCSQVFLSQPAQLTCNKWEVQLSLFDCTPIPQLAGLVQLDYSRTWQEFDASGPRNLQIYRFIAKVDMGLGLAPASCVVPSCLDTYPTAFYHGYLDYAFDCSTGGVEVALMLFHNCDAFIHHPLSTHPGAFHSDRSYAIVAPSTLADPFVASNSPAPAGAMIGEAVRLTSGAGGFCVTEDPLSFGDANFLGAGCGCTFSPTPMQLSARRLRGTGTCPGPPGTIPATSFLSANTMPSFPWVHDMATSIGSWTTGAGYPGIESVWADEVPIFYQDACAATFGNSTSYAEVYYGATTHGGYDVVPIAGAAVTNNFVDLASNTSWAVPGPPPTTFMGSVLPTRNLIYFNLP